MIKTNKDVQDMLAKEKSASAIEYPLLDIQGRKPVWRSSLTLKPCDIFGVGWNILSMMVMVE